MSEHAPDRIWSGIDIPKTIAGVLAAISAAVIGSFLGVAGTLVGAAVASVVGSVGTEIYQRVMHKGAKKVLGTFTTAPAAVGTPEVAVAADEVPSDQAPPRKLRWSRVAMVAGALFVLAMGSLTVVEAFAGKSIADVTRGTSGDRATVSSFWNGSNKSDKSGRVTPSESPSADPSSSTADTSGTTAPTTVPTDAPDSPTPAATTQPTEAPTTGDNPGAPQAPTGGADPGTGGQVNGDQGTGGQGGDQPDANTQQAPDNPTG